jgi:hypothetical protein
LICASAFAGIHDAKAAPEAPMTIDRRVNFGLGVDIRLPSAVREIRFGLSSSDIYLLALADS